MITSSKGKLREHIYDKWISGIDETYPIHANIIKDMMNVRVGVGSTGHFFNDFV